MKIAQLVIGIMHVCEKKDGYFVYSCNGRNVNVRIVFILYMLRREIICQKKNS